VDGARLADDKRQRYLDVVQVRLRSCLEVDSVLLCARQTDADVERVLSDMAQQQTHAHPVLHSLSV